MKLEKGKWYKWFQTNHNNTHIGKFDSISRKGIHFTFFRKRR